MLKFEEVKKIDKISARHAAYITAFHMVSSLFIFELNHLQFLVQRDKIYERKNTRMYHFYQLIATKNI